MTMGAHNVASMSAGLGFATRLAMLEVESEQAQYDSDCKLRDAAREAKREHNKKHVEELRSKASALMAQAFTSGALQIGAGVVQFASVSSKLEAGQAKLQSEDIGQQLQQTPKGSLDRSALLEQRAPLEQRAMQSNALANRLCASADILKGSADVVAASFGAVVARRDANAAAQSHAAGDAQSRADDAGEAARRRQTQLDQKLGILQQILEGEAETRRMLLRG